MLSGPDITIRLRRTAPRMWTGAVETYGKEPCRRFARSPRDLLPALRRAFARESQPFVWIAN